MTSIPPVIAWDYQFAPNAQKSRNYLYATYVPFKICEQPFVLPRPTLTGIGITYRRVPVLSIGKDVFCDNTSFIDALQALLEKQGKGLKKSPHDRAYEAWGYRSFWVSLPCVPATLFTDKLVKDRTKLFPVFARKDFAALRQNGLSELRSMMATAENEFLTDHGTWIGGASEIGLADIHANWMIKWALQTINVAEEPHFSAKDFPRVWKWISAMQKHSPEVQEGQMLEAEAATKQILASEYACPDIGVDSTDPLGFKRGESVQVEMTDAEPGTYPQAGKLVGLNKFRSVVELDNGIRVHFPRIGYVINSAAGGANGHS